MPYTLTKGLLWFVLALVLGVVLGWLLRSIRATRQLRAARHARHDAAELERLRARVAALEPRVGHGELPEQLPEDAIDSGTEAAIDGRVPADPPQAEADLPSTAERPGELAAEIPSGQIPSGESIEPPGAFGDEPVDPPTAAPDAPSGDDLTEVDGIDADVAELCHSIGIVTWADLAGTEVSLLRTMLADAGAGFADRDPSTWPPQAELLATGRRAELARFVERGGGELPE